MNPRILELAEQAAEKHGHTINFTEEITETLDTFAELIVQECIEVLETNNANLTLDFKWDAIYEIEKHFGVE